MKLFRIVSGTVSPFLFVKDGNIESAAVIFGQEVTVQTGFSFTVPFNLGSVELRGFERLDSRLVADLVIVGDVFQFITQFVPLETFAVQQLDSDVISIVTDDISFFESSSTVMSDGARNETPYDDHVVFFNS